MKKTSVVTTTTTTELKLDFKSVLSFLRNHYTIPDNAVVSVHMEIPTGGDYSGEKIHVTADVPLIVTWTVKDQVTNGN